MATYRRGEVWLVDLGYAAKVRPGLILSVAPGPQDRVLITLVPHTTSVRGRQFEVAVPKKFLSVGAFDAQGLVTVPPCALDAQARRVAAGRVDVRRRRRQAVVATLVAAAQTLASRICPEAEEPMLLGDAVGPMFFRNFVARIVLAAARLQGI